MSVVEPTVLSERVDGNGAVIQVGVPSDLAYCAGHFPGEPIVPGVVHVKWALALARRALRVGGVFAGVEALKFHEVLRPGAEVTLELTYTTATAKLQFAFRRDRQRISSGRVLLKATT
jgi:3-hydroxymyristoyl/3-hydroxydecanoyl-(acyl carrier protein) dehydratase